MSWRYLHQTYATLQANMHALFGTDPENAMNVEVPLNKAAAWSQYVPAYNTTGQTAQTQWNCTTGYKTGNGIWKRENQGNHRSSTPTLQIQRVTKLSVEIEAKLHEKRDTGGPGGNHLDYEKWKPLNRIRAGVARCKSTTLVNGGWRKVTCANSGMFRMTNTSLSALCRGAVIRANLPAK